MGCKKQFGKNKNNNNNNNINLMCYSMYGSLSLSVQKVTA